MVLTQGRLKDGGFNPKKIEEISGTFANWVKTEKTPTICALIARKGKIVLNEAHGVLNAESGKPKLSVDAIFPLASLTKPLTAACIVLLMEDRIIDGFSKVNRIISEFSGSNKDDVNIHHLLTHTPGIEDEKIWKLNEDTIAYPPVPENQHPQARKHLEKIYFIQQDREPGKLMTYSNSGYDLLAEIVRRISGKNIADFAKERIFNPLGMKDTHYIVPDELLPRIVKRRNSDPNGEWMNDPESPKIPDGPSGGYSTIQKKAAPF